MSNNAEDEIKPKQEVEGLIGKFQQRMKLAELNKKYNGEIPQHEIDKLNSQESTIDQQSADASNK